MVINCVLFKIRGILLFVLNVLKYVAIYNSASGGRVSLILPTENY